MTTVRQLRETIDFLRYQRRRLPIGKQREMITAKIAQLKRRMKDGEDRKT